MKKDRQRMINNINSLTDENKKKLLEYLQSLNSTNNITF